MSDPHASPCGDGLTSRPALGCALALALLPAAGVAQTAPSPLALPPAPAPTPTYLRAVPQGPVARSEPGLVASPALQACVVAAVHRLGLDARVRDGDLGVALADLTRTPLRPAFAGLNTARMVYGEALDACVAR